MKKSILFCTLLAIVATACTNDESLVLEENPQTELLKSRAISELNPNLLEDWEQVDQITLSSNKSITPPWKALASIKFDAEFATDIKKEDGWIMLFHSMNELSLNQGQNYMFFYNRLTGFLKVFYYRESDTPYSQNGMWQLYGSGNTSLFNLSKYLALPDNVNNKGSMDII